MMSQILPAVDAANNAPCRRIPDAVVEAVIEALRGIQFGQIVVNVQDGRVVQIDRIERRRLRP